MKVIILILLSVFILLFNSLNFGVEIHKVVEVIDGDTVVLDSGDHVRYLGIDTPEIHHPTKPKQCYGDEATKRNQELVEGKYVFLERDEEDRDKYDRLLRYVYVGFTSVNAELVREGFAYSYYYPPDLKYYKQYAQLELGAKKANIGLWANCLQ